MRCSLLTLSSYLDDELEARRRGELEAHLVGCQRCRAGLGHLREEVERIGGLAPVLVPPASVLALLEQTGLIGGDQRDPETQAGLVELDAAATPDWMDDMAGSDEPARHAAPPAAWRAPDPAPLPPAPAPAAQRLPVPEQTPPEPGLPAVPAAFSLSPAPPPITIAMPPNPPVPGPLTFSMPPPPAAAPPAPAPGPLSFSMPPAPPPMPLGVGDAVTAETEADVPRPAAEPVARGPEREAGPELAQAAPAEMFMPELEELGFDVLGSPEPRSEQVSPAAEPALTHELPPLGAGDDIAVHAGDAPVPPIPSWSPPAADTDEPPPPLYPLTDADVLEEAAPPAGRFAVGPIPAVRPSLMQRVRDRMAMQRALARTARQGSDDAVEIISGTGAPPRRGRAWRQDPEGGRPLGLPPIPDGTPAPPAHEPVRDAVPTADRWMDSVGSVPRATPAEVDREEADGPRRVLAGTAAGYAGGRAAAVVSSPRPEAVAEGRRLLAVFGIAVVVMFVVGLRSGHSISPAPTAATAQAPTAPRHSQPATVAPRPSAAPSGVPSAAALPGALTGVQTVGSDGTGFQVKDLRYGVHPGDFRIVFDLAAATGQPSGTPTVTAGLVDPTTLIVALSGVVPSGDAGQLPNANPVASATIASRSPIAGAVAYQFKLAHPVTFRAYYATGPLRLVVDLT